jgi:ADP-heptose:LPS heptosyltransferase
MNQVPTFAHTGDLGDVIASLPIVRALGGGHYVCFNRPKGCRESLRGLRYEALEPLLKAQPYIESVRWSDTVVHPDHDFSTFRHDHIDHENLIQWQARHIGVSVSETPWIIANPSPKTKGRVLFARSQRYHNPKFPWDKIIQRFKDPLFIGLPSEYMAFQTKWGKPLESYMAENLLELAELIAGCELLVCNQSCPYWLAAAVGAPVWQETWPDDMNSIVERDNARFCLNGTFHV